MVVNAGEPSNLTAFPLPPSTPVSSTYPCQLGSQHAKNNFRPRQFKRIPSSTESHAALRRTLQKYWGHKNFRGPQLDICLHALRGCDVLVVAPTGLGKSVCFQVPAVTIEYGITIVVSPLLALMRDQVSSMRAKGIEAYQLNEKTDPKEIQEVKRQLRLGHPQLRLLYVTPETLLSPRYKAEFDIAYRQKQLVRFVVDEAHVIDEWGSTFRPMYRRLGEFRQRYPSVPITALTASATSEVRNDMLTILNMPKTSQQGLAQWVEPFNRKNLFYEIRHMGGTDRQNETVMDLTQYIRKLTREAEAVNQRHGVNTRCVSGLVYCRLTADCETVAEALSASGVSAKAFHAKLPVYKRNEALDDWKSGRVECIVATIAFGMGVDQAHVRYVVHYDMPKSFEGYYQETGRAGRDGHMSRCVLYYSREDALRLRGLISKEVDSAKTKGNDQETLDRGKLRMINSFKALQHYAESISNCRHISICRYFGEEIKEVTPEVKEQYCNGMCDVCSNRAGVYHRSHALSEDFDIASPIIQPVPLEPSPEYTTLSSQAGRNSLAMLHGSTALLPTARFTNLSPVEDASPAKDSFPDDDIPDIWLGESELSTPFRTPAPRPPTRSRAALSSVTPMPRVLGSASARPLWPSPAAGPTPTRLQTVDQLADDGLMGAVVILGDDRTPEYAEQKRKARESAFKGVSPATPGGPLSFYNSGAPRKRAKVSSSFKTPFLPVQPEPPEPPAQPDSSLPSIPAAGGRRAQAEPLFLPGPSQFEPEPTPPARVAPGPLSRAPEPGGAERDVALQKLREALRLSFGSGELAEQVLGHWDRREVGDRRLLLLKKVARELELDIAKMARLGESYNKIIAETCAALKLVRDARGVSLIIGGQLGATQDPRVERLRHVEQCMRGVRIK